jgi:hypothetical protein
MMQPGVIADLKKEMVEVDPALCMRKDGLNPSMVLLLFIEKHKAAISGIAFFKLHDARQFFRNEGSVARTGNPPAAAISEVKGKSPHPDLSFSRTA